MRKAGREAISTVAMACGLLLCLAAAPASAQAPDPGKPKAAPTRTERAAADAARRKQMRENNAALRARRDACLQERKEKKIAILERPRFIRECMARPNF